MSAQIQNNLEARIDAIDPHVHSGPSIAPRAIDHLAFARLMSTARFAAVITTDRDYSGVMTAAMIADHHPELCTRVYSSIVLNNVIGGFNACAVEHTAAMGGKTVCMPTLAAEHHLRLEMDSGWLHPASTQKHRPAKGIPVLDVNGDALEEVKEVLDIVAKRTWRSPAVISTSAKPGRVSRRR